MIIRMRCVGTTPLLMNAMSESTLLSLPGGVPQARIVEPALDPRAAADRKRYLTNDGKVHLPPRNIYSGWIESGRFFKLEGKKQISSKECTVLPEYLSMLDRTILLECSDGSTPVSEVDIQQGVNPSTAKACCIIRPRFDDWAFTCSVLFNEDRIFNERVLRALIDKAGRSIGLGDFRPQKKGTFGQYRVDGWTVEEDEALAAE